MVSGKKEIECFYLDRFLSLLTPAVQGTIEPTEEPDFLIRGGHECLGVEITELHRAHSGAGRPLQADQAMRQRVTDRAKEIYERSGNPPVHVSVFFNDYHPVQKSRVDELANAIANLAARNRPELGGSTWEEYDWENRDYFPEHVHALSVHRFPSITNAFFTAPGATWLSELTPDDVQRVLEAKEQKYQAYLMRCDAVWLVINCDGPFMSTWFDFDPKTIIGTFRSSFDRVFIVRHIAKRMHELRVHREP